MTTRGLRVEDLTKSFRGEQVLSGVDLAIEPGELCLIVGPSGSGKSTLLECIAGLLEFERGRVYAGGEEITDVPVEDRGMGLVFQEFEETLFPHMSVAENVAFGLRQGGQYSGAEIDERVDEMLALLAIGETRDDPPDELSGGQQQRVELARQLVRETDVLLLDDPLADLDYKLQKRMELELRRLHADSDRTFVYVTHNQERALRLAEKLVVMNRGQIEQVGTPEEVYYHPENAFVGRFVGDSNLLTGRAVERDGDTVVVETEVGTVAATAGNEALSPAADAVVLVRPEDVAFGETVPDGDNAFAGTFEGRTYTGETTEFALSVARNGGGDRDHVDFQVIRPGNVPAVFDPGDRLQVGWTAADAACYDEMSAAEGITAADLEMS